MSQRRAPIPSQASTGGLPQRQDRKLKAYSAEATYRRSSSSGPRSFSLAT
jgi:hypothetical protein